MTPRAVGFVGVGNMGWPMAANLVGTPAEVTDIVGRYRDAGADELIVPDATLGPLAAGKETCDLFIDEVAAHFRS